jgi:hypothetical protein
MAIVTNTTTKKGKKVKRICSECNKSHTRIHKWSPTRADGKVPEYEHWYRDGAGGFLCFSCYMKDYWKKRKEQEEEE